MPKQSSDTSGLKIILANIPKSTGLFNFMISVNSKETKINGEIGFLTNPEIRKLIEKQNIPALSKLGHITFQVLSNKKITLDLFPYSGLSLSNQSAFINKGIASTLELLVLKHMIKQGYAKYKISRKKVSSTREAQLKERFGKRYKTLFTNPPNLEEELKALEKYIKRENLKRTIKTSLAFPAKRLRTKKPPNLGAIKLRRK